MINYLLLVSLFNVILHTESKFNDTCMSFSLMKSVFFILIAGQSSYNHSYSCSAEDNRVEFSLSSFLNHTAENPTTNCSMLECQNLSSNNITMCLVNVTPCYQYTTINNNSFCAPGALCSILTPCDNITRSCAQNSSVCVVNSCCEQGPVCVPLLWSSFCPASNRGMFIF